LKDHRPDKRGKSWRLSKVRKKIQKREAAWFDQETVDDAIHSERYLRHVRGKLQMGLAEMQVQTIVILPPEPFEMFMSGTVHPFLQQLSIPWYRRVRLSEAFELQRRTFGFRAAKPCRAWLCSARSFFLLLLI
jgi:hypothetical protein